MRKLIVSVLVVAAIVAGYYLVPWLRSPGARVRLGNLRAWFADPAAHPEWQVRAGERCGEAPFIQPTDGYIGFLWGDSFRAGHTHQGIDVFGPRGQLNSVPVVAAASGYLTREASWKSAVIIRVPSDPLQPGRQIWTFYTHMADRFGNSFIAPEFPPGTFEKYVEQGDLLGYQGDYSGDPDNPVGMHLHFSVVKDNGRGGYENELEIANTYDPTPYLGLELNAERAGLAPPTCAGSV
jgi:murein DD-endopeptidase MepM/ murein hydrolase activator NlpD